MVSKKKTPHNRRAPYESGSGKGLYISISKLPEAGRGLFASTYIPAGTLLGQYVGERITPEELDRRYPGKNTVATYVVRTADGNYIDAANNSCMFKYINDCEASGDVVRYARTNAQFQDTSDGTGIMVLASENIRPTQEIYAAYGVDYWSQKSKSSTQQ